MESTCPTTCRASWQARMKEGSASQPGTLVLEFGDPRPLGSQGKYLSVIERELWK